MKVSTTFGFHSEFSEMVCTYTGILCFFKTQSSGYMENREFVATSNQIWTWIFELFAHFLIGTTPTA